MITHITVEDAAKLISRLTNANKMQALTYIREAADRGEIQAADDLEKLQAENEKLRAENIRWGQVASEQDKQLDKLQAELKQVKRERDAAVEGLRVCSIENNMECQYCLYRTARSFCWNCTDGSNWKFRGQKED